MADFLSAYRETSTTEGGYANNHNDTGGETMYGISRKHNPQWAGWKYIDAIKAVNSSPAYINREAAKNQTLQVLRQEFYKTNYWYPLNLQLLNDQQLAKNVYDFGVNAGIGTAAKRLQMAANSICGSLTVDGQIGSKTISAINKLNGKAVYDAFNGLRKQYYDAIIAKNKSQEEFRHSWYSRIVPYKNLA